MRVKRILIIIQRSNGDVFLSSSLIQNLNLHFNPHSIDLLVNDDTMAVAKMLPFVKNIFTFSYKNKNNNRVKQEINILKNIYKKYDLSINLTSSDRSVLYAVFSAKYSISAVEKNNSKSWWKKLLLQNYYFFDSKKHILLNNLEPLKLLKIKLLKNEITINQNEAALKNIKSRLADLKISKFVVFHPSSQYGYKVYPRRLREELLNLLNSLNIPIIVSGGNNSIDNQILHEIPVLTNVFNWIGTTSIEEFAALSYLSQGYIGMDTLNMHIAASQNKRIFAIFGPTNLLMWAPWSIELQLNSLQNTPVQTYGNITIFQADLPCVACGKAGCDDNHGKSKCLDHIAPNAIYDEVSMWQTKVKF